MSSAPLGHEKKKPCFTGGQTCQVELVGQVFFIFIFFFIYGSKNDPQNTKVSRNFGIFAQKKIGKIFRLIFKKFQPKFSDLGQKMADLTRF